MRKTEAPALSPLFFLKDKPFLKLRDYVEENRAKVVEIRGPNLVLITHPDVIRQVLLQV